MISGKYSDNVFVYEKMIIAIPECEILRFLFLVIKFGMMIQVTLNFNYVKFTVVHFFSKNQIYDSTKSM